MLYDLRKTIDAKSARIRLEHLISRGAVIEMTERRPQRSLRQNAYLHLILAYFAAETGNTLEWVKQQYYKRTCNPDLFIARREDDLLGSVTYVRSSADLSTEEMSRSIERFRNWAAAAAGIYIPEPDRQDEVLEMQREVERYRNYLY